MMTHGSSYFETLGAKVNLLSHNAAKTPMQPQYSLNTVSKQPQNSKNSSKQFRKQPQYSLNAGCIEF